jgi:hypothetical protein
LESIFLKMLHFKKLRSNIAFFSPMHRFWCVNLALNWDCPKGTQTAWPNKRYLGQPQILHFFKNFNILKKNCDRISLFFFPANTSFSMPKNGIARKNTFRCLWAYGRPARPNFGYLGPPHRRKQIFPSIFFYFCPFTSSPLFFI